MKELAKKYNAEIIAEDFDEVNTGQLMRKFDVSDYEELAVLNDDETHYIDQSTDEEICKADCWVESIINFENGAPVSASYSFTNGNHAGTELEDDVQGVLDFWKAN